MGSGAAIAAEPVDDTKRLTTKITAAAAITAVTTTASRDLIRYRLREGGAAQDVPTKAAASVDTGRASQTYCVSGQTSDVTGSWRDSTAALPKICHVYKSVRPAGDGRP